jgi:hypothetical protein
MGKPSNRANGGLWAVSWQISELGAFLNGNVVAPFSPCDQVFLVTRANPFRFFDLFRPSGYYPCSMVTTGHADHWSAILRTRPPFAKP